LVQCLQVAYGSTNHHGYDPIRLFEFLIGVKILSMNLNLKMLAGELLGKQPFASPRKIWR
jgi:hypothetical protein